MTGPMKKSSTSVTRKPHQGKAASAETLFDGYPAPVKAKLLALRRLIFEAAKTTKGVGALEETLKWASRAI